MTSQSWQAKLTQAETPPPWGIATAIGLILGYLVVLNVVGFVAMIASALFTPFAMASEENLVKIVSTGQFIAITNGAGHLAALGMIYWVVNRAARRQASFFALVGLESVSLSWLGVAAGGAALLVVLTELVALLPGASPVPWLYTTTILFTSPWDWIALAVHLVLIAPLVEEVLHRGVFYPAVAARYGVWAGMAASIVVYGALHLMTYGGDWAALLRAFAAGMLYTFLRAASKSTWPGIVAFTLSSAYLLARTMSLL
ncbi:MAG: CPBP family intramembrane metalloprotease [Thermoflexales bacterium]|nr:CPBP family intramembrane metalloprotease [Thermoflexales bacterium]